MLLYCWCNHVCLFLFWKHTYFLFQTLLSAFAPKKSLFKIVVLQAIHVPFLHIHHAVLTYFSNRSKIPLVNRKRCDVSTGSLSWTDPVSEGRSLVALSWAIPWTVPRVWHCTATVYRSTVQSINNNAYSAPRSYCIHLRLSTPVNDTPQHETLGFPKRNRKYAYPPRWQYYYCSDEWFVIA